MFGRKTTPATAPPLHLGLVGIDGVPEDQPVTANLDTLGNLAVVGATGTGKTTLGRQFVTDWAVGDADSVVLARFGEYDDMIDLDAAGSRISLATSPEAIAELVDGLHMVLVNRTYEAITNNLVTTTRAGISGVERPLDWFRPILLLDDALTIVTARNGALRRKLRLVLDVGPRFGVYTCALTNFAPDQSLRRRLPARLAIGQTPLAIWRQLFPSSCHQQGVMPRGLGFWAQSPRHGAMGIEMPRRDPGELAGALAAVPPSRTSRPTGDEERRWSNWQTLRDAQEVMDVREVWA